MQLQKEIEIETPEDVYNLLKDEMKDLKQECFKVILLNPRNKVIKYETVALGTLDASLVHPRDVFRLAIENNAASLILVHNHPSGDPEPSDGDIEFTKRLINVGQIICIEVKDHIIVGNNAFNSLKERSLI